MVKDQEIIRAFYSPEGEQSAYVVVWKKRNGDYWQKHFFANNIKEAKVIGREYVSRFVPDAIVPSAVVRVLEA